MSISMEEALGIKKPEPKAPPVEEELEIEYSSAELKTIQRDKIILDETANKGATIPEIYQILREKGHPACQKTIWTVLHSDRATKLREELERTQSRDIALLRAYARYLKQIRLGFDLGYCLVIEYLPWKRSVLSGPTLC